MFDLPTYLEVRRRLVDETLARRLPPESEPPEALHKAMRYSVLGGGKRLRPILCMAACEAVGRPSEQALTPALALELLHTYTLIHDDLPCMDNDSLRRGRATAHVVFGEANALLAGDALLTLAFEWLADAAPLAPYSVTELVRDLAHAAGSRGVVGGQVADLQAEGGTPTSEHLRFIHQRKTGELIRAAVRLGAMCGGASLEELSTLTRYGEAIGLAFQVADDILNATSTPEMLGKPVKSDVARQKATYVALHGLDGARREAERLSNEAVAALDGLKGDTTALHALALHTVRRTA